MNQREYVAAGVVIKRPSGLQNFWQFILPPFAKRPRESLCLNLHYFTTLKMLQEAYPTGDSLRNIDVAHIDCQAQQRIENSAAEAQGRHHRVIKRTLAFVEGQENLAHSSSSRRQRNPPHEEHHDEPHEEETTFHEEDTTLHEAFDELHEDDEAVVQEEEEKHQDEPPHEQPSSSPPLSESDDSEYDSDVENCTRGDPLERAIEDEDAHDDTEHEVSHTNSATMNLRELMWTTPPIIDPPEINHSVGRIRNQAIREANSPLDVFFQLFPLSLIERVCAYSNIHKRQYFETNGEQDRLVCMS